MTLVYKCKHCSCEIGRLNNQKLDLNKVGWGHLTSEEKTSLMNYQPTDQIEIKSICEDCQELLESNPANHELDYFIQ
ncbi:anti-sigma-F factor Fin family protein [Gracilibacillus oryzae]|uniref:Anti-sigma-F factor Fin family protein n=1 Tax=Gracilibacillus oryzae TaxID=1672701 RepID=A0A7C8GQY4_9BACI|nr:anti-sigma-F factor Fin [Gracilibacillus oryzae]KAB8126496.1 anti-sigma-F factor Fin family protein [Gracilibacillus oryzae]